MVFKNEEQLKAFLIQKCKAAMVSAEEKVHRTIDGCLKQYYDEFDPDQYIRTSQLLHSLVRSGIKSVGGGFEAEIYFDVGSLNYTTGSWDGKTVLKVAMESSVPHGGYTGGTAVWTESMIRLGNVFELLKQELIKQGIPIK